MENAFSRLLKVLSLERKQGYRNKAVIGGLDKFASRWETDARAEISEQGTISEIVALLIGYPSVADPLARERILDLIDRRLREVGPTDAGIEPAPPRPAVPAIAPVSRPGASAGQIARGSQRNFEPPGDDRPASLTNEGTAVESEHEPVVQAPAEPGSDSEQQPALRPADEPANGSPLQRPTVHSFPSRSKPEAPGLTEPGRAPQKPKPSTPRSPSAPADRAGANRQAQNLARASQAEQAGPEENAAQEAYPVGEPARALEPPEPVGERERERGQASSTADTGQDLDAPVIRVPTVGAAYAEKLARLGVNTVRDLLYLLPHRYEDYSVLRTIDKLSHGDELTIIGTIWKVDSRVIGEGRRMTTATVGDGTGEIQATWFNPFVERQLHIGQAFAFSGKVGSYRGRLVMNNPEFEPLERNQLNTARLVPIYPLTQGISAHFLRKAMDNALKGWAGSVADFLPEPVRMGANLMPLGQALTQIHYPDNQELLAAAHHRLSFDEFLVLQLGLLNHRYRLRGLPGRPLCADEAVLAPFLSALPFSMTEAQARVLGEICDDLSRAQPMSRLLQGDVGSGKTAVAAAALWVAVSEGAQGAIMAPTEILAEQHARSFSRLFSTLMHPRFGRPVQIALLTGRTSRAEREEILGRLAAGEVDIAVGTHALIQDEVSFKELAVTVVDEQHRFGVEQRAALRDKGLPPHMLVMSATPIPRSLALTMYGDLDVSVIDQLPAGRMPIKTKWLLSVQRERAYSFVRRQVAEGRQAFMIYPLVEKTEGSEAKAAVDEYVTLQKVIFPELRTGLLHGRMAGDEKDAVMRAFVAHELDILVATSVIEVGIDVPNAAVIVIDGAERFGLAQLHQFRGRVGRGEHPSYCLLISDAVEGAGQKRLQALETNHDGFALAEEDLKQRGPGDFLGTRQSGLPPLRTANLGDMVTLEQARVAAQGIFAADPELKAPEHAALAEQVAAFWSQVSDAS